MPDGTEPIDPDERVYRRIVDKSNFYNPGRNPPISQRAFNPTPDDNDGISLTRASYVSGPEEAASFGFAGKQYYIIEMRAGDLEREGLILKPDPLPGNMGHALIPAVNSATAGTDAVQEMMDRARRLPFHAYGPFPGTKPMVIE